MVAPLTLAIITNITMHRFTTKRLLIRPLAEQDRQLYLALYTDPKIMRCIGAPLTVAKAQHYFSSTLKRMKAIKPGYMAWAIVSKEDNQAIGIEVLDWRGQNLSQAYIGIMLLRRAHGQSFATEAKGGLIEYAFANLSLSRIYSKYLANNLATIRVNRQLGFVCEVEANGELSVIDAKNAGKISFIEKF